MTVAYENDRVYSSKDHAWFIVRLMMNVIAQNGKCSINDFYILSGAYHRSRCSDRTYGWKSAERIVPKRVDGGWKICLPEPQPLNDDVLWDRSIWDVYFDGADEILSNGLL